MRNFGWLQNEQWWIKLSPRAKRVQAMKMLIQRVRIFNEVKSWRKARNKSAAAPENGTSSVPDYCNKCGLCCEVASGMPDFPVPAGLPKRWRVMFANGLGRGHRFCPFLWEDNGNGGSLCSIYELRSNPCRLFDSEECDFFWKSPEPENVASEKSLLLIGRLLANLVNTRKLPLAASDIPAKRPKLLELHRI